MSGTTKSAASHAHPPVDGGASQDAQPLTAELVFRWLHDRVHAVSPGSINLRVVFDVPMGGGRFVSGSLPIPATSQLSELADQLYAAIMKTVQPGEWLNGAAWAAMVDENLDHKGGSFKRAVNELKDAELIESSNQQGYRAKR